jgi:hypothetical protein
MGKILWKEQRLSCGRRGEENTYPREGLIFKQGFPRGVRKSLVSRKLFWVVTNISTGYITTTNYSYINSN